VWSFRPDLSMGATTLTGKGEFGIFTTDQWPF
jgi:hypothetical protein